LATKLNKLYDWSSFSWKKSLYNVMIDFIAAMLVAIGIYNFAANANFPLAGVSGLSLMAYHVFGFPIGWAQIILNIPIVLICYRTLGKTIMFRTARTVLIISLCIDYVAPLFPVYTGERLLAAIMTAAFAGLGYAMVFMNGSSSGGVDLISLTVKAHRPHLSIGRLILICDVIVIIFGSWVYRDIDGTIYGLLISFLMTTIIDKVMYGTDAGKVTLIITNHGQRVADEINEKVSRGSTIVKGKGSYSGAEKDIVLCACNPKQMYQIRRLIKKIDPESFTVIMETTEVVGMGFKED